MWKHSARLLLQVSVGSNVMTSFISLAWELDALRVGVSDSRSWGFSGPGGSALGRYFPVS